MSGPCCQPYVPSCYAQGWVCYLFKHMWETIMPVLDSVFSFALVQWVSMKASAQFSVHIAVFVLADKLHYKLFCSLCPTGLPYIRLIPKVTAIAGEALHLKCPVAGYPIEEIRWEKSKECALCVCQCVLYTVVTRYLASWGPRCCTQLQLPRHCHC
jgi:hypothetical protein